MLQASFISVRVYDFFQLEIHAKKNLLIYKTLWWIAVVPSRLLIG